MPRAEQYPSPNSYIQVLHLNATRLKKLDFTEATKFKEVQGWGSDPVPQGAIGLVLRRVTGTHGGERTREQAKERTLHAGTLSDF